MTRSAPSLIADPKLPKKTKRDDKSDAFFSPSDFALGCESNFSCLEPERSCGPKVGKNQTICSKNSVPESLREAGRERERKQEVRKYDEQLPGA